MVQFGEQLDTAIYEPWRDFYIQYNKLKRIITRNRFILDSKKLRSKNIEGAGALSRSNSILLKISKSNQNLEQQSQQQQEQEEDIELALINIQKEALIIKSDESLPIQTEPSSTSTNKETSPLLSKIKRTNTLNQLIESGFDIDMKDNKLDECKLEDFFETLSIDIEKINAFFSFKVNELKIRFEELSKKRGNSYRLHHTGGDLVGDLKEYRSIYKELSKLIQFCDYNKTGNKNTYKLLNIYVYMHKYYLKTCF